MPYGVGEARNVDAQSRVVMTVEIVKDFLASARVFARCVRDVVEEELLNEMAGKKVSFAQLKLLFLVEHTEAPTIGDAGVFLRISKAGASRIVEQLVRRQLIERVEIAGNRRTRKLYLTEAGRQLMHDYELARDRWTAEILGEYPEDEIHHTAETLDRLSAAIARHSKSFREPCLQCETYYRDHCRFQELCDCTCYHQTRWGEKREITASASSQITASD
jgi:DNA-binding MarR family transcriptional regulator